MNYFNPYNLDVVLPEMKEQIDAMREAGAEVIVFYI